MTLNKIKAITARLNEGKWPENIALMDNNRNLLRRRILIYNLSFITTIEIAVQGAGNLEIKQYYMSRK